VCPSRDDEHFSKQESDFFKNWVVIHVFVNTPYRSDHFKKVAAKLDTMVKKKQRRQKRQRTKQQKLLRPFLFLLTAGQLRALLATKGSLYPLMLPMT
jgi:predicted GIY-YIG superfamily endonuclease